jgi:AcrR family transcriptional regulator
MGSNERREREKAELRQNILEAARELFVKHGDEAVTMRKIAERIEYSATAIYAYFPDKQSLLTALCEHEFAPLLAEGAKILNEPNLVQRIHHLSRLYVAFAIEHPHQYFFMFMGLAENFVPSESALLCYELTRQSMQEAIAAGLMRADLTNPDLLAQAFWSAIHGVASLHVAQRLSRTPRAQAPLAISDALVLGFLRGVLRDPTPLDGVRATPRASQKTRANDKARGLKPVKRRTRRQSA